MGASQDQVQDYDLEGEGGQSRLHGMMLALEEETGRKRREVGFEVDEDLPL